MGADFVASALWQRKSLTVAGGVQRKMISLALFSDVLIQWIMHAPAAASPAAKLSVFLTASRSEEDIDGENHINLIETNPYWAETATKGGVWPTLPSNSIGTDYLTIGANAAAFAMVLVEPLQDLPDFSLLVSQQARGGG